jgi:hypothetical protein
MLIYSKKSWYCVAVRECTVSVWEINNIYLAQMLIYIMDSWYCVAVRGCMVSVWEINNISSIYINL